MSDVSPLPTIILLVEDEFSVLNFAQFTLRANGFRVLTASNGQEALDVASKEELPIDLLLTDVAMPQMSGRELADKLKETIPNLRVLYLSGYSDELHDLRKSSAGETASLQKPFSRIALLKRVREVLNA